MNTKLYVDNWKEEYDIIRDKRLNDWQVVQDKFLAHSYRIVNVKTNQMFATEFFSVDLKCYNGVECLEISDEYGNIMYLYASSKTLSFRGPEYIMVKKFKNSSVIKSKKTDKYYVLDDKDSRSIASLKKKEGYDSFYPVESRVDGTYETSFYMLMSDSSQAIISKDGKIVSEINLKSQTKNEI